MSVMVFYERSRYQAQGVDWDVVRVRDVAGRRMIIDRARESDTRRGCADASAPAP